MIIKKNFSQKSVFLFYKYSKYIERGPSLKEFYSIIISSLTILSKMFVPFSHVAFLSWKQNKWKYDLDWLRCE